MTYQFLTRVIGMTGWMIKTFPIFSSGPSPKYVLLWNGTLILVAIGFSATCRPFSWSSDVWAKDGVAATMRAATATRRQLDRRVGIPHQPFRAASHFSADRAIQPCRGTLQ